MIVTVLIMTGQSNSPGVNAGETGTHPGVRYWFSSLPSIDDTAWGDLTTGTGKDVTVGRILSAAGLKHAILSSGKGGTSTSQWLPPSGSAWIEFAPDLTQALAALPAQYPAGTTFRYIHVRDQGETEARYANVALVDIWAAAFDDTHAGIEAIVGAKVDRIVIQTNSNIDNKTHPGVLEAQQLLAAGDAAHLVDRNGCEYEVDGVHLTSAGYIELGELVAAAVLDIINMGNLSTYAKNAAINNKRNKGTHTPAATHYFSAYVAGVLKGTKSLTSNSALWAAATGRTKTNAAAIDFAAAGSDWGNVDEIRIHDADPAGAANEIARHTLDTPVNVLTGEALNIAAGAIDITCPAGMWVDAEIQSTLNMLFGGTAETPRVTTYLSYWLGDPQGAGSQLGSRVASTQATDWAAASGGVAASAADIALTGQPTATYMAEHTASSGGTLISSFVVQTAPSSGIITAGRLRTTIP